MKLNIKLISLIITLIIFSGCTENFGINNDDNVVVGKDGVRVEIMHNGLLNEIGENSEFDTVISLTNFGRKEVTNGIIDIFIDQEEYLELDETNFNSVEYFSLDGIKQYDNPNNKQIYFKFKTKKLPNIEAKDVNIKFDVFYEYETNISEKICINTLVKQPEAKTPCIITDIEGSMGQGSPVVISAIKPGTLTNAEGVQFYYDIFIKNDNTGKVLNKTSLKNKISIPIGFKYDKSSGNTRANCRSYFPNGEMCYNAMNSAASYKKQINNMKDECDRINDEFSLIECRKIISGIQEDLDEQESIVRNNDCEVPSTKYKKCIDNVPTSSNSDFDYDDIKLNKHDFNIVHINSVKISSFELGNGIDCNKRFVNLNEDESVRCITETIPYSKKPFPTNIVVSLSYGYYNYFEEKVTIVEI